MEPFQFRLENLRELKIKLLREEERRLGKAAGACNLLKKKIKNNQQILITLPSQPYGDTFHDFIINRDLYRNKITADIKKFEKMLLVKEQELKEVLDSYHKALKEKKVLDKLREKKAEEYNKKKLRHEDKFLDDISTGMYSRRE